MVGLPSCLLNVIKGRSISASQQMISLLNNHPSFVGVAYRFTEIRYPICISVITNLLGNVIITKDLKGANEIGKTPSIPFPIRHS